MPRKRGPLSPNGVPGWTQLMVPLPLAEEALEGLTSPSLDIKDWLNKFAPSAVLKMKEEEEGGGGFSNRGKKEGILSATTGDRKWVFKCRCSHAFGCPAAVSVTVRRLTNTLVVEGAAGWLHKHDGDRSTSEGLPPSIKALIQKTIEEHPGRARWPSPGIAMGGRQR